MDYLPWVYSHFDLIIIVACFEEHQKVSLNHHAAFCSTVTSETEQAASA